MLTNLLAITKVEIRRATQREWVPLEELVGPALGPLDSELASIRSRFDITTSRVVDPILTESAARESRRQRREAHAAGLRDRDACASRARAAVSIESTMPVRACLMARRASVRQVLRGHDAAVGGVGLGLAVCRAIAAAHDGSIEAVSRPAAARSFRVWFPDDGAPPQSRDAEALSRAS